MSDQHEFVFIQPRQSYANHWGAVVVQNVKEMVARVIVELAQSGGEIGKITFESQASWSGANTGYFYIGLDEISPATIKQHAPDLVQLAPHFADEAQVSIYARCGNNFNGMATYMLSIFWPGVSVSTTHESCGGAYNGYRPGAHHGHRFGGRSNGYRSSGPYHGHYRGGHGQMRPRGW